ncbi:Transcription factor [Penicillium manginii]|uniref:Transcription factor n=1 Tax=Penicillium manginii TaxID=203109 RepID=UPI0025477A2C|nr:Transcription factor [Penicillium manginii]KAJ5756412.1 Transcription factor [Penicillium manginii]
MAPKPTKRSAAQDDDFVLTLSDDEDITRFDDEEEIEPEGKESASDNKKRKRETDTSKDKSKKQKQQAKNVKGKKGKVVEPESEEEEEDEEVEEGMGVGNDDGALDPEFEFDVGGVANVGVTEGFDGWGLDDTKQNGGDKKAVDIDDIITRRNAKKEAAAAKKQKKAAAQKEESDESDDEDVEGGMDVDFGDDELLAEDGFGMGVDGEEEESEAEGPEPGSGPEDSDDEEEAEDSDDDAASDNDSVATPVGHPDDRGDVDGESDAESEVDEEEQEKRNAFFAPEEKIDEKTAASSAKSTFQDFNLSRPILRGLASVGFTDPTPIQRKAIPVALLGKDIVGSAVTGSGKTGAFIVPILERLLFRPRKTPTSRVTILMPTRELAVQCYNVAIKLATFTDVTFCQLVGGFSLREQENILKKRPDVIIATPGRFIDHMRNSPSFTVDTLEILVLDEADRMLEDGFADELNEILTTIPKSRQTMLFSATMTDSIDKLIRSTPRSKLLLFVYALAGREKRLGYLLHLCKELYTKRVIIFFRQKKEVHRVRIIFGLLGLKAAELYGSMSQEQRIKSVENFRDGKVAYLLATDLASRGLDIKGVETVINYEAPQSHEIYLHRVGRTARAGRSGCACTIAAEPDRKVVKAAVKAGKAHGAKIISRVVEMAIADDWAQKAADLADEVEEVLEEEKIEKQMAQAEMQVTKGQNLMKHGSEIMSRPKRTWFESEQDKRTAKKLGRAELNGPPDLVTKKEKIKLSNKDKKRLDDSKMRHEGDAWLTCRLNRLYRGRVLSRARPVASARSNVTEQVRHVHDVPLEVKCVCTASPTLSYTKQLETRVAQLEDALAKHQSDVDARKISSPASVAESSSSAGRKIKTENDDTQDLTRDFDGLNVENDGRISFHGPTSLFQLPSGVVSETASTSHFAQEMEARKERLINSAWRERAFEQMAAMPEPFQYLLDSHWCWIQPLFNFVYRPAFTRDMKIQGPYYSDILMNALLSHSVRWCKAEPQIGPLLDSFDGGAQFYQRAVSGLHDSLKVGYAGIPTIQTLLLLSAQECGRGNRTQAWLYSGMAFRLLDDLGISIDSRKYPGAVKLSDEDIEIRNRLFWSCYFWDKIVSLYFGRAPTMQHSRVSPPRMILDDTSEIEIWTPHGVTFPDGAHYPPTQAHSTSCFMRMCGLAEVLNQILIHIYDPMRQSTEAEFFDCVQEQSRNLSEWWDDLPDYLKLVATDLPPYSPPSHIMTLNCLYHTVNILLHRPILCSRGLLKTHQESYDTSHLVQCMSSATSILSLFDLYRRTFGDNHVVLSLAYSIYTAASIFLLEIQALKYAAPGTLDKLKFCIFALERVKLSNPVITTALNLLYQEIQKLQIDIGISAPAPADTKQPQQQPTPPSRTQSSQSPSIGSNPSRHVSPGQQHQRQQSRATMSTQPNPTASNTSASMMPGYSPFQQQAVSGFDLSQMGEMPQMPATHLLGGMPNAVMTVDDPGSYEITPEVFEAFSYAQPIATNMASFETNWQGQG